MKCKLWLLIGWLALAGCAQQAPPPHVPDVLAMVGSRPIRIADLEVEAARRAVLNQAVPVKEKLLEELIAREAMLARALELGLAEQADVRRRYENILLAALKERELQPRLARAEVPPELLRAAGASNSQRQPAQVRLAVLRFGITSRTSAAKRGQLAERLAEARAKASRLPPNETGFGAMAVDYSDDQSTRYHGGDLGWFDVGGTNYALPPPVLAAGQALARGGDVSEVLRTEHGLFLVRLMERRDAGRPSVSGSDAVVHHKLLAQEYHRIEAGFAAEARSHVRVELNTQALASVQLSPRAQPEAPALP
jgi:parvulin-like peptidyl-prolyl isomerase